MSASVLPDPQDRESRLLQGSLVLASIPTVRVVEFDGAMSEWLPGKRFELLFRMSVDGGTAAAFHSKCDGKGPTVTLIRSDNDCVFGGYAGSSWESVDGWKWTDDRSCFLFSVVNPFGDPITKMPNVGNANARKGMYQSSDYGPAFGEGGCAIWNSLGYSKCNIKPDGTYGDPLGRGKATFTGAEFFTPAEVEVWQVL